MEDGIISKRIHMPTLKYMGMLMFGTSYVLF